MSYTVILMSFQIVFLLTMVGRMYKICSLPSIKIVFVFSEKLTTIIAYNGMSLVFLNFRSISVVITVSHAKTGLPFADSQPHDRHHVN